MRVTTPSQQGYLRIDYAFFDMGMMNFIDPAALTLYMALKRFVWRSTQAGSHWCKHAYAKGMLATFVAQPTLAARAGMSQRSVRRHLETLKQLGWVHTILPEKGGALLYSLGGWAQIEGARVEYFFADVRSQELLSGMLTAHDTEELNDIPFEARVAFLKNNLDIPEVSEVRSECPGGTAISSGGSGQDGQGVRSDWPREVREEGRGEEKEENDIEEAGSLRSPDRVGPSFLSVPPTENGGTKKGKFRGRATDDGGAKGGKFRKRPKKEPGLSSPYISSRNLEDLEAKMAEQKEATAKLVEKGQEQSRKSDRFRAAARGEDTPERWVKVFKRLERVWRETMGEYYPDAKVAKWGKSEQFKVRNLVNGYDEQDTEVAMQYLVENWAALKKKHSFLKTRLPTLAVLASFHEVIVNDARRYSQVRGVVLEYRGWRETSDRPFAPGDLEKRYTAAQGVLKELGLMTA